MKNTFLKLFSSLQNERHTFEAVCMFTKWKTGFWSVFRLYKMKTCFLSWNSLYFKKKERFKNMYGHVSVFYFVSVKNSSKMCFFLLCDFKNSLQNVLFYFCQNERRFKTFMILFAKTKNTSKMCVSFLNMKYDSKAWSMKFLLK